MKCVSLSSPGPHVFVIVLSVDDSPRKRMILLQLIKKIFGHKACSVSALSCSPRGDDLEESIQDYVNKYNCAELKKLIMIVETDSWFS